jgi:hypothetical protein
MYGDDHPLIGQKDLHKHTAHDRAPCWGLMINIWKTALPNWGIVKEGLKARKNSY